MNLNNIKRIDINSNIELKEVLATIHNYAADPFMISGLVYDAKQIKEEGNSLLGYWFICSSVLSTFSSTNTSKPSDKFTFKDYIDIIANTFKELNDNDIYLAYMSNLKKWIKIILSELSSETKAQFYAIDKVISEQMNSEHFIPLSKYISEEDHKTRVLYQTYYMLLKSKM